MAKPIFTAEELAELAAFDAEIDAEAGYDPEEVRAARELDFEARQQGRTAQERAIAEKQREYRAANREAIAEYQREYRAAGSDEKADESPLRAWRFRCGFTGKEAAVILGVCQASISNWERGITPIPRQIMTMIGERRRA